LYSPHWHFGEADPTPGDSASGGGRLPNPLPPFPWPGEGEGGTRSSGWRKSERQNGLSFATWSGPPVWGFERAGELCGWENCQDGESSRWQIEWSGKLGGWQMAWVGESAGREEDLGRAGLSRLGTITILVEYEQLRKWPLATLSKRNLRNPAYTTSPRALRRESRFVRLR
jgi:hypothetical protein